MDHTTDHPRGCGENIKIDADKAKREGSPPRMRGKPKGLRRLKKKSRITPADAGKTHHGGIARFRSADHPRGCGENAIQSIGFDFVFGSPPRMRGKRVGAADVALNAGITPADAGKTIVVGVMMSKTADHPRGCGENVVRVFSAQLLGLRLCLRSPPRMRGKHLRRPRAAALVRITPADAGKTSLLLQIGSPRTDHPRGCGENQGYYEFEYGTQGSPPRMRGKPISSSAVTAVARITPADAGKTQSDRPAAGPCTDHPRGCGENRK